ncbi:MAG: cell surface protein SprA [Bacteroidales bacterium]|nr:cell surface protein SprA [Bacteroidales bacterium]
MKLKAIPYYCIRTIYLVLISLLMLYCKPEESDFVPDVNESPKKMLLYNSGSWKLSSVPASFPEADLDSNIASGFNRGFISWYTIDHSIFYEKNSPLRPPNITNSELSNYMVFMILETMVYPYRDIPNGEPILLTPLEISFYPEERGPYNFDTYPSNYSEGINEYGKLFNPESRWGGIMRKLDSLDFQFNYFDFWLLDPLRYDDEISGELYINIGQFSEDILQDGKKFSEQEINLQSLENNDTTCWGIVPNEILGNFSFENELEQDFGLDGLNDIGERAFFADYLNNIQNICNDEVYQTIYNDPANDDYHCYRGEDYDNSYLYTSIVERYKRFSNLEGNTNTEVVGISSGGFYAGRTKQPDSENLNYVDNFQTSNSYFEYRIDIDQQALSVENENYLVDIYECVGIRLANGEMGSVKFYHFRIPIENFNQIIGNPILNGNYKSIRIFLKRFNKPVVLRLIDPYLSEEVIDEEAEYWN